MQSPAHGRRPHGHLRRAPGAGGHPAGLVPPYSATSQGSAGVAAFGELPAAFVYQLMPCVYPLSLHLLMFYAPGPL
jgi:hypothetical protein